MNFTLFLLLHTNKSIQQRRVDCMHLPKSNENNMSERKCYCYLHIPHVDSRDRVLPISDGVKFSLTDS